MTSRVDDIVDSLHQNLRGRIAQDEPMSLHTSWRVGGPADLFIEPADSEDLITAVALLREAKVPYHVIGFGSNMLVADRGVRGAVIAMTSLDEIEIDGTVVQVGPGVSLVKLVRTLARAGLSGIENLVGIPGTVGGAIVMNAGAMGQDVGSCVESVTLLRAEKVITLAKDDLGFSYRTSIINPDDVVLSVRFTFKICDKDDLEQAVKLALDHRQKAQKVGAASAGSVFKNPAGLSAWKLIEESGLRGHSIGGATISEQHTNFIVNSGDATAGDILQLIGLARNRVLEQSGVELIPEVHFLGYEENELMVGER